MFDVEASDSEGVRRIVLVGEFDLAAMPTAETSLAEATANGYAALEIDLSALTFLDSSGVRSLMITVDRCRDRGRIEQRLVLVEQHVAAIVDRRHA